MSTRNGGIAFSLRVRMTVVLTTLLLVTLGVLQYANQRAQREVQMVLDEQKAAVKATVDQQYSDVGSGVGLAAYSFGSGKYMYEILEEKPSILNHDRVLHVLVVDSDGTVSDASEERLTGQQVKLPEVGDETYFSSTLTDYDPFASQDAEGPHMMTNTYWLRVKTRSREKTPEYTWIGVVYSTAQVSNVLLDSQQHVADVIARTSRERLQVTLGIFILAVLLTIALVWRFTHPVRQLSDAAVRVASGDLDFRVGITRRDEIGQLSRTFDEMIAGLKAKAELEDRLNNAERAAVIGRLTSAIAHEIRNPLNFINLSIDHVRSKYAPADDRDRERFGQLLGSVKDETARLNRLVTDVLNFGRPANLNARAVDLRAVVDQSLAFVRSPAQEQGVEIELDLPDEPATVEADAEKLKSCFSNIAINAVQAMPAGGELRVSLERKAEGYRVRLADTGAGIPADALDRIFEPYYSTKDTGTGLGLAVTKKIIEEHGGAVLVYSTVGRGTTFEVDLPFERPVASARAPVEVHAG